MCQHTDALPGVGPKTKSALEEGLSLSSIGELLLHLPNRVIDRRQLATVASVMRNEKDTIDNGGQIVSMVLTVVKHAQELGDSLHQ